MLTISDAKDVILAGVLDANTLYRQWSGGLDVLDSGVESLVGASIAKSLHDKINLTHGDGFVTLETPFSDLWRESKTTVKGRRPRVIRETLRADVVYWDNKDLPRGVVEVKRRFEYFLSKNDIARTCKLLDKLGTGSGGALKWGAVAGVRIVKLHSQKGSTDILKDFLVKCHDEFPSFKFTGRSSSQCLDQHVELIDGSFIVSYDAYVVLFRKKME